MYTKKIILMALCFVIGTFLGYQLANTDSGVCAPKLSPDGKLLKEEKKILEKK